MPLILAALSLVCRADVRITEFVAQNTGHLLDDDGDSPDWIELHNPGQAVFSLAGWTLSDDPRQPSRWVLPAVSLGPGERRIVFASGKDRRDPAAPLHTNFAISKEAGGFLALRRPDGSVASEFANYPAQFANISFGVGILADAQQLVGGPTSARLHVPTDDSLGTTWTGSAFDDSQWTPATHRIGYDLNSYGIGLPIAYWTFDDTTSSVIADSPKVTLVGASFDEAIPGPLGRGKSLAFSRASSTYAVADLDVSETAYTSSFWFRSSQASSGLFAVTSGNLGASGHDRHVYLSGGNIRARTWSNETITSTGKNYADDQWHHVAHVVGAGIGQRLYVDGVQVAAGAKAQSDFDWQSQVHIGFSNDAGGGSHHDGRIDDVAIWSESLDQAAVAALASGTAPDSLAGFAPHIGSDVASAMREVNATAYLRLPFSVNRATPFNHAELKIRYDGGFVAFINGVEIARRNAPDAASWQSAATVNRAVGDALIQETIDLSGHLSLLSNGAHLLAIHALNDRPGSPEFLLNVELHAATLSAGSAIFMDPPSPGTPNTPGFLGFVADTDCFPPRGIYTGAQSVTITCQTPGATISYTVDGTDPSPSHGIQVPAFDELTPPSITIPLTTNRGLRMMAYLPSSSLRASRVAAHSYLFLPQILGQSTTQPDHPTSWAGRTADYGMDPKILSSALPGFSVAGGLLSLPTISVTCPVDSLFASSAPRGIYYDTTQRGPGAERKVSVEWINPDGSPGWQVHAGMRPHGNSSRQHSFTPKHPLRLNFRSRYGDSRLRQDLYHGGLQAFDELLLRACSTDSFPVGDGNNSDGEQRWNNDKATYMRDQYIRDLLNELGHPNCRGVYTHLYLNGLYWGLYNLAERPTADWFSSTFGGAEEQWDVIKDFQEVAAGDAAAWNAMAAILADSSLSEASRCQKLLGNYSDGTRNPAFPVYLHWPSFRDYMIVHIAAGAEDWPDHNYWAGRRKGSASEGFRFVAWDQEISNDSLTRLSGRGSNAPFESVGDPAVDAGFPFGPAKIYDKLRRVEPFKSEFRERTHQLLFNGGALTPEAQRTRWKAIQERIDQAIVAESARWGDGSGEVAKKRETTWLGNMAYMNAPGSGYWDAIHPISVRRFRNVSLYPSIDQPLFSQQGGRVPEGFELFIGQSETPVYYTLDGSDPMGSNGLPTSTAIRVEGGLVVQTPIPAGSRWHYLVTPVAAAPGWRSPDFVPSGWSVGHGEFGYGNGDETTVIGYGGDANNRNMTTYFRREFPLEDPSRVIAAKVFILRDDGAVIHLNGVEVGRSNMPAGDINYSTPALNNPSGIDEITYFETPLPPALLREGGNVLAVEIHKSSPSDGDLSFDARLEISQSTADSSAIRLDAPGWVNARARNAAGEWSGINSAWFAVGLHPPDASNLVISELHYHPSSPVRAVELAVTNDPDAFEFIELMNVGAVPLDLTGTRFTEGVEFDFPDTHTLAPGARCVVVRDPAAFMARYGAGRAIAGSFAGGSGLSNRGETLALALTSSAGVTQPLFSMTYEDRPPWPSAPDGRGPSLVMIDPRPLIDHSNPANWTSSADLGGNPARSAAQITFADWIAFFADSLVPDGDDDADGIVNLLEYALLLDPLAANPSALPVGRLIADGGLTYLSITFRHRPAADLEMIVETSGDLVTWHAAPEVVLAHRIDHGDGSFTETWRCSEPHGSAANPERFLRIRCRKLP